MFVKRYGRGPRAFVCIHGWNADHRSFDPVVPFLPEDATLYALDLPGCGGSPLEPAASLASVSAAIARAFEELGATFTLVGHCTGAILGMNAALNCPELLERVVLIDTFAAWPWYFRVFTSRIGPYAYASTFANPIGRWITDQALASHRSAESSFTEGFARHRHDVNLQYLQIIDELKSPASFASLEVPVDVIFGTRTFRAVRNAATVWRQLWPHCDVWELPRTGHLALRESAAAVAEIVFEGAVCQPALALTSNSAQL